MASCMVILTPTMLAYKEAKSGEILHEGINERKPGQWGAVHRATLPRHLGHATHNEPMIPIYIFPPSISAPAHRRWLLGRGRPDSSRFVLRGEGHRQALPPDR